MRIRQRRAGLPALSLALATMWAISTAHADDSVVAAAKAGNTAAVQALLKKRADVNATEVDGSTALLWAAYQGNVDMVRALLAAKADPNAANRYGMTPLLQAARLGSTPIVQVLLEAGANADVAVRRGETPLMAAAGTGNTELVKLMIANGVDVNAKEADEQQTALIWAIGGGHVDVVKVLLEAGADPNHSAKTIDVDEGRGAVGGGRSETDWIRGGLSPLMFAARGGHLEIATALIDAGANLDARTRHGVTAMLIAVLNDRTDMAQLLLKRGADVNDGSLLEAVLLHNLRGGATAADATRPRLDHVNEVGPLELIEALLVKGADPNRVVPYVWHTEGTGAPRPNTQSAYVAALQARDLAVLQLMVDRKLVDANAAGSALPLMEISLRGGGVVDVFSRAGTGPYRHASDRDLTKVADLLVAAGADVNGRNAAGETPMHRAAMDGDLPMMRYLAGKGVDLTVKTAIGLTALDYAMGKLPPPPPGAFPFPRGPQPQAVALLRELMGLPVEKAPESVASAGN